MPVYLILVFLQLLAAPSSALASAASVSANSADIPGPFQFREAFLLESRVQTETETARYDPNHTENRVSRLNYGVTNPIRQSFIDMRSKATTYQGSSWVGLLPETDQYRHMGGLALAEEQYLNIVKRLREMQGSSSDHLAFMLDHLAEFYLEERRFDLAYQTFSEAVQVRRSTIDKVTGGVASNYGSSSLSPELKKFLRNSRIHLSDLLTRLGQLDLGKDDLISSKIELAEAVTVINLPENIRYTDGLYSVYYLSKVLEIQKKWKEAENLWRDTVRLREEIRNTAVYWDAQKEMAAFYARSGDFRSAAEIARVIQAGLAATRPIYQFHQQLIDNRPRPEQYQQYTQESDDAMNEILAIDTWKRKGSEAAVPFLANTWRKGTNFTLDHGSDAERTELIAWFQKKTALHLSILLDGAPSQDSINSAYTLLSAIKGRYLSSISEVTRLLSGVSRISSTQIREFTILDQLAAVRESQARVFLASAQHRKEFDVVQFAANDNKARLLSGALSSSPGSSGSHGAFSLPSISRVVPPDAAFIDFIAWERTFSDLHKPPEREYGAFIIRHNQPLRYIRLGLVESVDSDIDVLSRARPNGRQRTYLSGSKPMATPAEINRCLGSLYRKMISPLQFALQGASKLYIVPDGKLALAPFSAFRDDSGGYLLATKTVAYLGSWRDLFPVSTVGEKPSPGVIVANPDFDFSLYGSPVSFIKPRMEFFPLTKAVEEAEDVQKTLGLPRDHVLIGRSARKWLVQSIQNPEILHIATHSISHLDWEPSPSVYSLFEFPQPFNTQYPLLQSVIALAGANRLQDGPEDGILTALEVSSLHLGGTSLVVLSSCESGRGTLLDGQGVLGLRAAFAMAGARATVMTLWPVNDEASSVFMHFFYSHLAEGPAEAVRIAQNDMLTKTGYINPVYWAGYVVAASPEVAEEQRPTPQGKEPSGSPLPTGKSAVLSTDQQFVSPNCFEFLTHDDSWGGAKYRKITDIRIKIGGVVRRSLASPTRMIYDLSDIGNDVQVDTSEMNVLHSRKVILASERKWLVRLMIAREANFSSISFQFGPDLTHPETNRLITLRGKPNLFFSLEIPQSLPPLASYSLVTDSDERKGVIDKVGFCSAEATKLPPQAN